MTYFLGVLEVSSAIKLEIYPRTFYDNISISSKKYGIVYSSLCELVGLAHLCPAISLGINGLIPQVYDDLFLVTRAKFCD